MTTTELLEIKEYADLEEISHVVRQSAVKLFTTKKPRLRVV